MDIFDRAVAAASNRGTMYGKMQIDGNAVKFVKGVGKVDWIEGQDEPKDRCDELTFTLSPIDEMGITNLVIRSVVAQFDEWSKLIWPSIQDCGVNSPRDVDRKFVKVQLVANGRTWTDKKSGELREGTTMKFLAIYRNETECKAAFANDGNAPKTATATTESAFDAASSVDMTPHSENPEREAAKAFLPALIKMSGGNIAALEAQIKSLPMVAKFFTVASPEVLDLLPKAA